jgi:hypothetical protein
MFSALRKRIHVSPTTVIATLALVFAMTGGAYAAKKYLITSTKQISPSVLKSLQGKAGPAGTNGAPGAQGAQGAQGPAGPGGTGGAKGEKGAPGTNGTSATSKSFTGKKTLGSEKCEEGGTEVTSASGTTLVCNGAEGAPGQGGTPGATGPAGSPWVAGQAPTGAILKGTWSIQGYAAAGAGEVIDVPISTGVPVNITETKAIMLQKGTNLPGETTEERENKEGVCAGSADNPLPSGLPGGAFKVRICIYVKEASDLAAPPLFMESIPLTNSGGGVMIEMKSNAAGTTKAYGAWVLTAE